MLIFSKAVVVLFTVAVFSWLAFSAALAIYYRGHEAGYKIGHQQGYALGGKMGMELGIRMGQQMGQRPQPQLRDNST